MLKLARPGAKNPFAALEALNSSAEKTKDLFGATEPVVELISTKKGLSAPAEWTDLVAPLTKNLLLPLPEWEKPVTKVLLTPEDN